MNKQEHLRWKCRRGMLELDILLNRYLDKAYGQATSEEQAAFEQLLSCDDPDLWLWLSGSAVPEDDKLASIVQVVRQCHV